MRLNNKEKISLLRSCNQVKIIDLTERIELLKKEQAELLTKNSDLKKFISKIYMDETGDRNSEVEEPTIDKLSTTYLNSLKDYSKELTTSEQAQDVRFLDYDTEKVFQSNLRTFAYNNSMQRRHSKALEEYRTLADKLTGSKVDLEDVKKFLDTTKTKHTPSFTRFAKGIKAHSPIHLSLTYGRLSDSIAQRNNIADKEYATKSGKVFKANRPALNLNRQFKIRRNRAIVGITAGMLALTIFVAAHSINLTKGSETQGIENPIGTSSTFEPETPPPVQETQPEEKQGIFRNSYSEMTTYEQACSDYFEKIADIYKFNTGNDINFSGYGQSEIGYSSAANIFRVELDGQQYIFSARGDTAPNYRYLQKALEATGAKVEPSTASLSWVVDKNNTNQSIAIADLQGNAVRSGKVLTGSNNAYNSDYVSKGREILKAQGVSNPSEAQCVGAYLLSDNHVGNPELSQALAEVQPLARVIKGTFYYTSDGKSDPYTVYVYQQKSNNLASDFEKTHSTQENSIQMVDNTSTQVDKGDER